MQLFPNRTQLSIFIGVVTPYFVQCLKLVCYNVFANSTRISKVLEIRATCWPNKLGLTAFSDLVPRIARKINHYLTTIIVYGYLIWQGLQNTKINIVSTEVSIDNLNAASFYVYPLNSTHKLPIIGLCTATIFWNYFLAELEVFACKFCVWCFAIGVQVYVVQLGLALAIII